MDTRSVTREDLMAMHAPEPPTSLEMDALRRLIQIAKGDTGQSRKVASFLLAWWNASTCGGFDLTDLWGVDTTIRKDMLDVLALVGRSQLYPHGLDLSLRADFEQILAAWRPGLVGR